MPSSVFRSYSVFYFCLFLFLSYQVAYFPLHCESLGFERWQIAAATTATTLAVIAGPPLVLQAAYLFFPAKLLFSITLFSSVLVFIPALFLSEFRSVLIVWFFCVLLNKGAHALVDAQAIRESAQGSMSFENARIWGSIGFVVGGALLGFAVDLFGVGSLVWGGLGFVIVAALASRVVVSGLRSVPEKAGSGVVDFGSISGPFLWLLLCNLFVWASHQVFYVYFSIHIRELGLSGNFLSLCWAVAVITEVVFFTQFKKVERLVSLEGILKISIFLALIRWLVLFSTTDPAWILVSQALHAFSFGGCYLCSMKLVHSLLPEALKDRGQGLLVAAGAGLGSLVGRLALMALSSSFSIQQLFLLSSILALVALPLAWKIFSSKTEGIEMGKNLRVEGA